MCRYERPTFGICNPTYPFVLHVAQTYTDQFLIIFRVFLPIVNFFQISIIASLNQSLTNLNYCMVKPITYLVDFISPYLSLMSFYDRATLYGTTLQKN
jgi:hypothetical protein